MPSTRHWDIRKESDTRCTAECSTVHPMQRVRHARGRAERSVSPLKRKEKRNTRQGRLNT